MTTECSAAWCDRSVCTGVDSPDCPSAHSKEPRNGATCSGVPVRGSSVTEGPAMSGRLKKLCILGCVTVATWGASFMGSPAAAAVAPATEAFRVEFADLSLTNACTGEQILLSGSVFFLDHDSASASGGSN